MQPITRHVFSLLPCLSRRLLLDEYLSQSERSPEELSALDQRLLPLVRLFESKYVRVNIMSFSAGVIETCSGKRVCTQTAVKTWLPATAVLGYRGWSRA